MIVKVNLLEVVNPSCLQATVASAFDHESSQTVPQALLWQISTRPSRLVAPSLSLMAPFSEQIEPMNSIRDKNMSHIQLYSNTLYQGQIPALNSITDNVMLKVTF